MHKAVYEKKAQHRPASVDELTSKMFRKALLIRLTEEKIIELYPHHIIQSPIHLSVGQEVVAVASCEALRREDRVFSSYRSHAYYIAKGGDLKKMFGELCGKLMGDAKGKAGSMHLTAPEVNFMGSSAIVASTLPHAVGAAYASRYLKENRVDLVAFGDGATEEGVYHESLNLASLHKLPVIFLCENNGYAVHSKLNVRHSYNIVEHARTYGIPTVHVENGMNFFDVYQAVSAAVHCARNGQGPQMVVVDTYRYKEHVGPGEDYDAGYRERTELLKWQAIDPLIQNQELRQRYTDEIIEEIEEAATIAMASPFPGADELLTDVDVPDSKDTYVPMQSLGTIPKSPVKYNKSILHTMEQALERSNRTIIFGQGCDDHKAIFGTTTDLAKHYSGARVFDTPIAEESVTGFTLGASLGGLYPIMTNIRADFLLLACNQLINLIAKYRYMFGGRFEVPMLIRCIVGRSWGQGAQHSQSLQSLFSHIPGLTVVMPSEPQSILETYPYIIEKYRGPVISFEHRLMYELEFEVDDKELNKPIMPLTSRLRRKGKDVTIVATSIMVLEARRAAQHLKDVAGIECEIIDLHCVSHPDEKMILDSVAKTGRLLIADTSWLPYGVVAEICRIISTHAPQTLKAPVASLGMQHVPCPTGKTYEDMFYPNLANFVDALAKLVKGRPEHGIPLPEGKSMPDVYKHFKGPF